MRRRLALALTILTAAFVAPGVAARADPPVPVVLLPGWHGDPGSFDAMVPALERAGLRAVAVGYSPSADGQHIPEVASAVVGPAIEAALVRLGYPAGSPVDIVGYSMGGLVARSLIEKAGWAPRVRNLVMLGTPNHGTVAAWVPSTVGGFGRWNATGADMRPGSAFLRSMGTAEPAGERYVAIGGAPAWLPVRYDGLVPSESPFLTGDEHYLVPAHHGALPRDPQALALTIAALGYRPPDLPPGGAANLTGPATIRLEYAAVAGDHDRWTDDENRFAVSVDPDGGGDGYVPVGEIAYERDGPFTQNWGDAGPTVGPIELPGTSPRIDIRIDLSEADPWGRQVVATAVLRDVVLSEDGDGMNYYEAVVPVAGGSDVFRVSLNGVRRR
jgi:triacylglycerol lipase